MTMTPRVVDISHHNTVTDLRATAAAGIWGVIHKSSQGKGYRDPDYERRRGEARDAGLLWGAYHFNDGSDVAAQVDWFIKCAAPDASTLMVLDFEDNPKSNMSVQQAVKFLRLLEQKTGRKGAIYSGNRLKESIRQLPVADRDYLCQHRLWLCQYGPRAVLPAGFSKYWLWQYTGDGVGQPPHNIAGIKAGNAGIDLNVYDGEREQLEAEWSPSDGVTLIGAIEDDEGASASTHSRAAEDDQPDEAPDEPDDPQPQHQASSIEIEIVKRRLDSFGYHEFGILNGDWGGKTAAAIAAYKNDRHLRGEPVIDTALLADFDRAQADGFQRPVADERANATAKDIQDRVPAVKQSLRQTIGAKFTAVGSAIAAAFAGISNQFQTASDKLAPIKAMVGSVPGWVWLLVIAAGATGLWYLAEAATQANVKDYNEGKRV